MKQIRLFSGTPEGQKLYLMRNAFGLSKIGISADPTRRAADLQNASGVPVEIISVWETVGDAVYVEAHLHNIFASRRQVGEWFTTVDAHEIEAHVCDRISITRDWISVPSVRGRPQAVGTTLRVQRLKSEGMSQSQVAKELSIGIATVKRHWNR